MKLMISSSDYGYDVETILQKYPFIKKFDCVKIENYFNEHSQETVKRLFIEGDERKFFEVLQKISEILQLDEFVLRFNRTNFKCEEIELYDNWRE